MDNRFEFTTQHCVQFLFTVSSQISSKYVCQSHDHFSRVGTNFETNLFFTGASERKEPTPLRAAPEKSLISPHAHTRVNDAPLQDRSGKKKGWRPCRFFLIFITLVFVIWLHSHVKATVSFTLALNLYSPKKRWSKCWIEPNLFPHYYPKATKPTFTWIFERCNEDW